MLINSRLNKLEKIIGGVGMVYIVEATGYATETVEKELAEQLGIILTPEDILINVPKLCYEKPALKLLSANPKRNRWREK